MNYEQMVSALLMAMMKSVGQVVWRSSAPFISVELLEDYPNAGRAMDIYSFVKKTIFFDVQVSITPVIAFLLLVGFEHSVLK